MTEWKSLSRIPAAPEYWEQLGARIQEAAHPRVRSAARDDAWQRTAFRMSLAAAAAAALVVVLRQPAPATAPSLVDGLGPSDPVAIELVARDRPPSVSELFPAYQRTVE